MSETSEKKKLLAASSCVISNSLQNSLTKRLEKKKIEESNYILL